MAGYRHVRQHVHRPIGGDENMGLGVPAGVDNMGLPGSADPNHGGLGVPAGIDNLGRPAGTDSMGLPAGTDNLGVPGDFSYVVKRRSKGPDYHKAVYHLKHFGDCLWTPLNRVVHAVKRIRGGSSARTSSAPKTKTQ